MVPTGYGRNDDNYEAPIAAPIRTELNSKEKAARYKVKHKSLTKRIEEIHINNDVPTCTIQGLQNEIAAIKELKALEREESVRLYEGKRSALLVRIKKLNNAPLTSSNEEEKLQKQLAMLDKEQLRGEFEKIAVEHIYDTDVQPVLDNINININVTEEGLDKFKNSEAQISPNTEPEMINTVVDEDLVILGQSDVTEDALKHLSKEAQEERQRQWDAFEWEDDASSKVSPIDVAVSTPREQIEQIAKIMEHNITKMSPVTIERVIDALKKLETQAHDMSLLADVQADQLRSVLEYIYSVKPLPDRKEASQWQNLFTKEKSKCEMLAEDNGGLREKLAMHTRHGKMQWIINDAITKVHTGVNTDVIILCHVSQADKLFKQLCDRVVDRLKEGNQKDVKILEDTKQKTNIIYYTDGSCIRIVNDSGCFIIEVPKLK